MKNRAKETTWRTVGPGEYARSIPKDRRRVNRDFVEHVAESVDSPSLRSLILKTGVASEEPTAEDKTE